MSYFDLLDTIRKSEPDFRKASQAMKGLGWFCIGAGIWNFLFPKLLLAQSNPFHFPQSYAVTSLVALGLLAQMFFLAASRFARHEGSGIRWGQAAIALLVVAIIIVPILLFRHSVFMTSPTPIRFIAPLLFLILGAQLCLPAWLGIKYLQKLFLQTGLPLQTKHALQAIHQSRLEEAKRGLYKEALLPFGIHASFAIMMGVLVVIISSGTRRSGPEAMPVLFLPMFVLIFLGPMIYNLFPSRFEKLRTPIFSCYSGGSLFLFRGSWPFFRLLVYPDGIEVRAMLNRFFIPYGKMEEIDDSTGFFKRGFLIRSNVPEVPSAIRLNPFYREEVINRILAARMKHDSAHAHDGHNAP